MLNKRTEKVEVRLTPQEKKRYKEVSEKLDYTFSEYVRQSLRFTTNELFNKPQRTGDEPV